MPSEITKNSPDSDTAGINFKETELTLGLPGESRSPKSGTKRGFSKTVELNVGNNCAKDCPNKNSKKDSSENENCDTTEPLAPVVGWPPVREHRRKNMMTEKSCKYVKVAVDGAPYLRKVDLEMYNSYQQLLSALEDMFTCFTIRNVLNKRKLMDPVNGLEYVPTYEDKDGDWMLVGDVPWKMFAESCKRLRLMKSLEALGLDPMTPPKCSNSSC